MKDAIPALLTVRGISKTFPGVKALDRVDFDLKPGEVHALVGENGAGKSTLMLILAGACERDEGVVCVEGVEQELESRRAAEKAGIRIVFQESSLLPNVTVCENLFSGEPPLGTLGQVSWKRMDQEGAALLKALHIDVDLHVRAGSLSTTTQKRIEIARALAKDFKILILDEPTAAITVEETEQLFGVIAKLREQGKSIIYISHRIKEIKEISDRVTILKDGALVGTYEVGDVTERDICERMVGRELIDFHYRSQAKEKVVLEVNGLSGTHFRDISFALREGEFLALAGLTGAGRTELALSLFGALPIDGGTVAIDGRTRRIRSPWEAMKAGIGYVTEDRKKLGLFLEMGIAENMESNNIDSLTPGPLSSRRRIERMALRNVENFNIRCSGIDQKVQTLSGGNQQKVCLSRWISYRPRILIVDEPTKGVDVGAKEEIYTLLNRLTREGISIIMISSDMLETLSLGDRILVMHEGSMMRIVDRDGIGEEDIVAWASGLDRDGAAS
ncbi:MAG: sugar ABC transporter ATP-binding protein [Planctomycetota bacterium]|nr:sugar ABC transporter ATP-binding protein [Planctomycetota bacterium]